MLYAGDLINRVGALEADWERYLAQVSETHIKRELSSLHTDEFYNSDKRQLMVKEAEKSIRETLAPFGVQLEAVLLRRYTFREEKIDQAIFKKNLQELEMAYNAVAGEFAQARTEVNKVEIEGAVRIQNLDKQGVSESDQVRTEGDLYRRQ